MRLNCPGVIPFVDTNWKWKIGKDLSTFKTDSRWTGWNYLFVIFYLVSCTVVVFCCFHFTVKFSYFCFFYFLTWSLLFFCKAFKRFSCFCQPFLKPLHYLLCTEVCHYVMIQWWYLHSYLQPVIAGLIYFIYLGIFWEKIIIGIYFSIFHILHIFCLELFLNKRFAIQCLTKNLACQFFLWRNGIQRPKTWAIIFSEFANHLTFQYMSQIVMMGGLTFLLIGIWIQNPGIFLLWCNWIRKMFFFQHSKLV